MERDNITLKIYFYAKKEPRNSDGKYPIMGRLVYGDKRMQFATQVFISTEMLPFIRGEMWRTRKTSEMLAVKRVYEVINMLYMKKMEDGYDIDLAELISEFKVIQKKQPTWWKVLGR